MRELFVTELIKNVMGPKGGIYEELDSKHKPIVEYVSGILGPIKELEENEEFEKSLTEKAEKHGIRLCEGDDDDDDNMILKSVMNPSLNPDKQPSTMGISFNCKSPTTPVFSVCITWAKYVPSSITDPTWKRNPKHIVLDKFNDIDGKKYFNSEGQEIPENNDECEISFRSKIKKSSDGEFFVSFFLTNRIEVTAKELPSRYRIFQPQIRVVCDSDTKIIPLGAKNISKDDMELHFLYRDKPILARGHMTSATWKDIDPEITAMNSPSVDFPECLEEPGFKWIDADCVAETERKKFLLPDVRTDFTPMYSVPAPQIEWAGPQKDHPELSAEILSQMNDGDKLRKCLWPLIQYYEEWTENQKNTDPDFTEISDNIVSQQKLALERMKIGLDLLCGKEHEAENEITRDVRLAFCFANKALSVQYDWAHPDDLGGFKYRPFQLAFILLSLESSILADSKSRKICDLLWVPTGAGKTEAYLGLVAILMAYKRLEERKTGKPSYGTKIISRYTLRMLTIQQFRRTLSLFTAAEFLRVSNLQGAKIGWVPDNHDGDSFIWGGTPFQVGLWVGAGVTPNRLARGRQNNGALHALEPEKDHKEKAEPAQVVECPQCKGILSVPQMGLESNKGHVIHLVVKCDADSKKQKEIEKIAPVKHGSFEISKIHVLPLRENFLTLSISLSSNLDITPKSVHDAWLELEKNIRLSGVNLEIQSTSVSRPGYFFRKYSAKDRTGHDVLRPYDFDIFCPNPECKLHTESNWIGTSLLGSVNSRKPVLPKQSTGKFESHDLGKSFLVEAPECFRNSDSSCDRIPIPALTVDEQLYKNVPTMIVSTVDKFARLPFEPKTGCLFGNLEWCHLLHGFYRKSGNDMDDQSHPEPRGTKTKRLFRKLTDDELPEPPLMIIQDELHLIDGPLGSMVGLYETAVDLLSNVDGSKIKYVASTATIRNGEEHVKALFNRDLQIFPPKGLSVDNRFFIVENPTTVFDDLDAGRLYLGLAAPGKGGLTPLVRMWSQLAQTAFEKKDHPEIDRFWTMTGYFNAVRELAGARALYRQDIVERIRELSSTKTRELLEENSFELSGRTPSENLPSILELLNKEGEESPDALFTTSMFGTGVDVPRLGLMLVNGQPKTTSSYIQSTGRVGRKKGALVITFFRTSKPRDLSHYEFFNRNHVQLHRTVEAPTATPFSTSAVERSIGPLMVSLLRNMRNAGHPWQDSDSPILMKDSSVSNSNYIKELIKKIEERGQGQPPKRKPEENVVKNLCEQAIQKWKQDAEDMTSDGKTMVFVEYENIKENVVLGDPYHDGPNNKNRVVFTNVPNSLREIEGETSFAT
jgi:hypothetical protein